MELPGTPGNKGFIVYPGCCRPLDASAAREAGERAGGAGGRSGRVGEAREAGAPARRADARVGPGGRASGRARGVICYE